LSRTVLRSFGKAKLRFHRFFKVPRFLKGYATASTQAGGGEDVRVAARIRKRQQVLALQMTPSHTLLHCTNDRLRAAREEAWEGKNPGGIRVLLNNPRWERCVLRFLELSGVGRTVEDWTDEDQERAERLNSWITWEAEEGVEQYCHLFLLLVSCLARIPFLFLCCRRGRGPHLVFCLQAVLYGQV